MNTTKPKPKSLTAEKLTALTIRAMQEGKDSGRPFRLIVPTEIDGIRIARVLQAAGLTSDSAWFCHGERMLSGWWRVDVRATDGRWPTEYAFDAYLHGHVHRLIAE